MTAAIENRNLAAETGNGNKHQQNRKKNQNKKKIKNKIKNRKKENQCHIRRQHGAAPINGWVMLKSIKICKVYVQSFPRAKLQCMSDYKKPLMIGKPDNSIVHVGTKDINSEVLSKYIAESTVDLAVSLKAE